MQMGSTGLTLFPIGWVPEKFFARTKTVAVHVDHDFTWSLHAFKNGWSLPKIMVGHGPILQGSWRLQVDIVFKGSVVFL